MTLYIRDGVLQGYRPGTTGAPDYSIPGEDILSFDVEQKVGELKDTGKLSINNWDDKYTHVIDHGDRIELSITGSNIAGEPGFGAGGFGEGAFGGKSDVVVWNGLVRDLNTSYSGARESTIAVDAGDFVSEILNFRRIYNSFRDRQIVGSNGIVNEILKSECPEIDRSLLPERPERTSMTLYGEYALKAIYELSLRLPAVMSSIGTALRFDRPSVLSPQFTLDRKKDHGTLEVGSQDENMRTLYRVRGGTDVDLDDKQTTHNGTATVTKSNYFFQRVETRKASIAEAHIYMNADRSGSSVTVRIQKDDGGQPVAPNNEESDIDSKRLNANFLDEDGYTPFLFGDHTLPEPNPWLIIQAGDETGQQVGINTATNELAYKVFYPYPIVIEKENIESSRDYRERQGEITKDSISTFQEARDVANAALNEHGQPIKTLQFSADSIRMHSHDIGEVVRAETEAATGNFVAMEKKDHYEGNQLETEFSFQALNSI